VIKEKYQGPAVVASSSSSDTDLLKGILQELTEIKTVLKKQN
jgi:hypothetical protein